MPMVMKRAGLLTILLVLASGLIARADKAEVEKKAKATTVNVKFNNIEADKALKKISELSGVAIKTVGEWKDAPKVNMELMETPVLEAVKMISGIAGLSYSITDSCIEVSPKKK
jgi:PBP1b-binding outer membrane lipoprotein LpoB